MTQVHKETLTTIENALPNRSNLDVEIFGMEGIPPEVANSHNQRVVTQFAQAEAERRAATGNPGPGGVGGSTTKKPKLEDTSDLKKRLAEHKAKKAAEQAAGISSGDATPNGTGHRSQSPALGPGQSPGYVSLPYLSSFMTFAYETFRPARLRIPSSRCRMVVLLVLHTHPILSNTDRLWVVRISNNLLSPNSLHFLHNLLAMVRLALNFQGPNSLASKVSVHLSNTLLQLVRTLLRLNIKLDLRVDMERDRLLCHTISKGSINRLERKLLPKVVRHLSALVVYHQLLVFHRGHHSLHPL